MTTATHLPLAQQIAHSPSRRPVSIRSSPTLWLQVLTLSLAACLWGSGNRGRAGAAESLSDDYTTAAPALEDQVLVASNASATAQPGEPEHWPGQPPRNSRWVTFRPPRGGVLVVDATDSDFPTVVAVYEGKAIHALTQLGRASASTVGAPSEVVVGTVVEGREYDIAVDGFRGATGTISLHIRLVTTPWIRRQPTPVTVSVDENAELSIAFLGHDPTTVQWQFSPTPGSDGAWFDLAGRTGSSLPLRAAKESDEGYYRARVSNRYGSVLSDEVQVVVQEPPKITLQPFDARRTVGESVEFNAGAVGGKPLSWRWQFRPLTAAEFGDVSDQGATQPTLSLSNLALEQAGDYRGIVSNFAGAATSGVARLTLVAQGPVITEQPTNLTVIEGNPASFRVRASGYQPITFQWKKDGTDILGATNSDYRLSAALPLNAGSYSVVVSNRYGVTTSATVRLTVDSRPPNDDFARRETVGGGALARVTGTNRLATFQLGEPKHFSSTATNSVWYGWVAPGRGTVTITILRATFDTVLAVYRGDMLGTLISIASNDDAVDTRSQVQFICEAGVEYDIAVAGLQAAFGTFDLEVAFDDRIQRPIPNPHLPPLVNEVGGYAAKGGGCATVTLSMPTLSLDPVSYQWFWDGNLLLGETNSTLVLRNVTVEMQGTYKVEARNGGGVTNSSTVLTVDPKPVIRPAGQPTDVTVRACLAATFQVTATACDALSYQWRRNGEVLSGQTGRVLRFPSVSPADAGGFDVIVSNAQGSTTSRVAQLIVDNLPRITRQPGPDQTVKLCDSFTLDVGTDDACGTPTFQWNFQDGIGSRPLADQTNRTLRLTATAGSAGDYWVTVSTQYGQRESSRVRVRVDAVPVVSSVQPTDQTILLGETILLQVQAEDRCGGLIYRWQRRSGASGGFSDVTLDERRTLRSDGALETLRATPDDAGEYRCVVGNGSASVTSRVAQITVRGRPENDLFVNAHEFEGPNPPVSSIENRFATAEPGEPGHARLSAPRVSLWYRYLALFPCEVTTDTSGSRTLAGTALDTVVGVYRGSRVDALTEVTFDDQSGSSGAARVSFLAGAGEEFYIAIDSKSADWGTVRVQLSVVEIRSAPSIRVDPLDQAVTTGATVALSAETFGSPPMQHVWLRDGAPVGRGSMDVSRVVGIPGAMRSTLTISGVREGDAGLYSLVVSNSLGIATSRRATVTMGVVVRGRVVDASTGEPIPGAVVRVGSEWTLTDANGDYTLIIPGPDEASPDFDAVTRRVGLNEQVQFVNLSTQGTVVLSCVKTNSEGTDLFIPYVDRQFKVRRGMEVTSSFPLSPILAGMRAVADWHDPDGTDLDLYCVVTGDGPVQVIYYKNPGRIGEDPFVRLELDRRGVTGPETANVEKVRSGLKYHFFVVKYGSARGSLASSAAVFRIYDRTSMVGSRSVPIIGGGEVWDVCEVDGATRAVTWFDRILSKVPFDGESSRPRPTLHSNWSSSTGAVLPGPSSLVTGVTYEWDFGDGSEPSREFAPRHAYREPGMYSVTVTMRYQGSAGPSSRSITRTNFVEVYNLPPTATLTHPANGTFYRAGNPITIQVEASDPDSKVRSVDLYEIIGAATNRIGTVSAVPYQFMVPSDLGAGVRRSDRKFFAEAIDEFAASTRTSSLDLSVVDMSGDILILWSGEVSKTSWVRDLLLGHELISDTSEVRMRVPRLAEQNQEGLRGDLITGFRLILFVQQGEAPAIEANTVDALESAWQGGTPIFLQIQDARSCAGRLDSSAARQWERLTGVTAGGSFVGLAPFQREDPVDRYNELFNGPWGMVEDFDLAEPAWGFELSSGEEGQREVRGTSGGAPALIRFPPADLVVPVGARMILQSLPAPVAMDSVSQVEFQQLFLNSISFLMGNDCDAFSANLNCSSSEVGGRIGEELLLAVEVSNNGECRAGGVVVASAIPVGLEFVSADCVSDEGTPVDCDIRRTSDGILFGLGGLPSGFPRLLRTRVRPTYGGTFTNTYTIRANGRLPASCHQVVTIASDGCVAPRLRMTRSGIGVTLIAEGTAGCEVMLERSTDLRAWEPVLVRALDPGPTVLSADSGLQSSAAFFRIRLP